MKIVKTMARVSAKANRPLRTLRSDERRASTTLSRDCGRTPSSTRESSFVIGSSVVSVDCSSSFIMRLTAARLVLNLKLKNQRLRIFPLEPADALVNQINLERVRACSIRRTTFERERDGFIRRNGQLKRRYAVNFINNSSLFIKNPRGQTNCSSERVSAGEP